MASQSCGGALEFVEGGVIRDASFISGDITNSSIQGSVINNSSLTSLKSIDDMSALTIVRAITQLDPVLLKELANLLISNIEIENVEGNTPNKKTGNVPRAYFGNNTAVMGEPDKWIEMSGGVVPVYK